MATTTPFATNPQLTAIALAYMNQPSDYVADHVMPRVKAIGKKEFQYNIYGLESFAAPDSRVGRKGRPNEVSLSSSLATAAIEDYGLEDPIPQDDIDQGRKDGRDIAGESTEYLLSLVKLDRELRVARLVQDKNNYAAACVKELSGGQGIDNAEVDAEATIAEMLEKPFMRPNIGVMSQKVWDRLSRNPLLIKAIKGELVGRKLTTAEFCSYFELEQLYIGKARVTRQVKGKTPVPERVWGREPHGPRYRPARRHPHPGGRKPQGAGAGQGCGLPHHRGHRRRLGGIMYATPEDIRARYKEVYPLLAGKDAEGRPDTAAVEQALAEAASEIDAILGTRFAVPVSPVPPVLRRIAVDLAVGALPRTGATEASMYERRAREARDLLDKLAAGEASLGPGYDPAPAGSGGTGRIGYAVRPSDFRRRLEDY